MGVLWRAGLRVPRRACGMAVEWFVCIDGMACEAYRMERVWRAGERSRRRRCARLVGSVVGSEMYESGRRRGQSRHRWSCARSWIGNLVEGRLRLHIRIRCFGMVCLEREGVVVVKLLDRKWARSRIPCLSSGTGMCYLLECARESRGKNATQLLVSPSTRDS